MFIFSVTLIGITYSSYPIIYIEKFKAAFNYQLLLFECVHRVEGGSLQSFVAYGSPAD